MSPTEAGQHRSKPDQKLIELQSSEGISKICTREAFGARQPTEQMCPHKRAANVNNLR